MHKPHSKLTADWRDHPADPAPVPSPIGDRSRGIASAILVLADASADAPTEGAYDEGFQDGAEHAYRTAAILVQAMSRAEDYR